MRSSTLSRRSLLQKAAGAALVGMAVGRPVRAVQGRPIRLGGIWILSGSLATYGQFAREGALMAVDEINAAGGVLGRPLEIRFEDEQNAEVAVRTARRLALQEGVDYLIGIDSSGVALAVVREAERLRVPLMVTHAATPQVNTELCNRYTFRISASVDQNEAAGGRVAAMELRSRRWTTISPNYAYGHDTWAAFQREFRRVRDDLQVMDVTAFPPLGAPDFRAHITRIMDARPEGVMVSLWGGDLVNFLRQAKPMGFFDQGFDVVFVLGAAMEVLEAMGKEMPLGYWAGTRYWFLGSDDPVNVDFYTRFHQRYGHYPSYNAQTAYAGIYAYKHAIELAGTTDREAVVDALERVRFRAPQGEVRFREDHQAMVDVTWGVLADGGARYPHAILNPMRRIAAEEITPPVSPQCKLAG